MQVNLTNRWLLSAFLAVSVFSCQNTHTKSESNKSHKASKLTSSLTLNTIYKDKAFESEKIGRIRWLKDGSGYTSIEDSKATRINDANKEESIGKDIVIYNPKTLARKVLISAAQLTPKGKDEPLEIDNYLWSDDRQELVI